MIPAKSSTLKAPKELHLCNPDCKCKTGAEPYFQKELEDGSYPESNCPNNPGPLDNGEYVVGHASVVTRNYGWFRLHCKNWKGPPTEEKRAHLKNCPEMINQAIDKFNESNLFCFIILRN